MAAVLPAPREGQKNVSIPLPAIKPGRPSLSLKKTPILNLKFLYLWILAGSRHESHEKRLAFVCWRQRVLKDLLNQKIVAAFRIANDN
jgi:hypothetical protein